MTRNKKKLYAIYKNKKHLGNEKAHSKSDAVKSYLIAADLGEFSNDMELINQYSVVIAINGIHHYYIK